MADFSIPCRCRGLRGRPIGFVPSTGAYLRRLPDLAGLDLTGLNAVTVRQTSTWAEPLLSSLPCSIAKENHLYGVGSEHPFANYWTLAGGLDEVVGILPSKQQADILIARFFECVDPVYPLLQGVIFYAEYDSFWQLPDAEKAEVEHSFLALIMIMLAIGTQFLRLPRDDLTSPQNQHPASELYASACHQALRLGAYLDRTSVQTLQAMVFMTYFLLNANHATAGWAFAGIIIRQAYALGLNREPSLLMGPSLTWYQKVERRRLWFAISNQDSFMSLILRLPPGATHADIDRAMLRTQGGPSLDPPPPSEPDPQEMSVSSSEGHLRSFDSSADTGYVNSLYSMALLIQQTISSPRSLWLPMAGTSRHRSQLLSRFRACYRSFPEVFRAWNEEKVSELYHRDVAGERLFRQTTVLITNYWHSIMLIQQEGTDALVEPLPCKSDMPANEQDYGEALACLKGTLEAAHEALRIFFVSRTLVGSETGIWWVLCHRAFIQALTLANLLRKYSSPTAAATTDKDTAPFANAVNDERKAQQPLYPPDDEREHLFAKARLDVITMTEILKTSAPHEEIARTRLEVLEKYL